MLLLVLTATFEKKSQKTVQNYVQCPDCCRIVFWINLFMMAAFQLHERVQLTWFHPRYTHTHTHTKGLMAPSLKYLFHLCVCPVCVCWLSFMYCLQPHSHTQTLNKSLWWRVPLRDNGLLFWRVVCFYGNSFLKLWILSIYILQIPETSLCLI